MNLFPKIKPYNSSTLNVSKLHTLQYEEVGNPSGKPIIFLHGGPGVGIFPGYRRLFDPKFYRIILLNQRGAGKSTPPGELKENTTWDLVEDLEKLRKHLNIKKWLVTGGSWGSTLALVYSIKYPKSVKGIIIRGVCLGRKSETDWLFKKGCSQIYPDEWEKFKSLIPKKDQSNLVRAYYKLLTSKNKKTVKEAAHSWTRWEISTMSLIPNKIFNSLFINTKIAISIAKIESHYTVNNFFFKDDNFILSNINKIKNISLKIIQGRFDVICPVTSAFELHQNHPKSSLKIVQNGSHNPFESSMASELIKASEKFKKLF